MNTGTDDTQWVFIHRPLEIINFLERDFLNIAQGRFDGLGSYEAARWDSGIEGSRWTLTRGSMHSTAFGCMEAQDIVGREIPERHPRVRDRDTEKGRKRRGAVFRR